MEYQREVTEEEQQAFKVGSVVLLVAGALILTLILFVGIKIGKKGEAKPPAAAESGQVAGQEENATPKTTTSKSVTKPNPAPAVKSAPAEQNSSPYTLYTVKSGDTLYEIALKNKVTWQEIAALNGINNQNALTVGSKIKIPKK